MTGLAYQPYLTGAQSKGATNDELELRQAIRRMCAYIADDSKVARHHGVTIEKVQSIRAGMAKAKIKGMGVNRTRGGSERSGQATGSSPSNPFTVENRMNDMIRIGSQSLLEAILRARGQLIG